MSEAAKPTPETPVTQAPAPAADPAKKGIKWVLLLILLSLTWYLLADRFTPYTQQARVGAFVIPVASEVAGRVIRVNVRNNQDVKAGEVLFEVDPQPYQHRRHCLGASQLAGSPGQ
jgi:multidrug resistance efflux pump